MKTYINQDGLTVHDWEDGNISYFLNGVPHRLNGPAVIHNNGATYWFKDGVMHREDGPAVEVPGYKKEWWVEGLFVKETFEGAE